MNPWIGECPTLKEYRGRLQMKTRMRDPPRVDILVLERTCAHMEQFNPIKQDVYNARRGALHSLEQNEVFRVVLT
jgi:hypothetical protein